jgi:predicted ABC-type ATPase
MSGRPIFFMIAGPNGAGKSTLYQTVIAPRADAPFINADLIQRDELKDPTMQASYRAAEIAEERRREHLVSRTSFVSESTFSHPSKLALIEDAKGAGFRVVLYHVNVRSADLSVMRVAHRVTQGGHDVPEDKIRERYERNQALIREAALRADRAYVYDNSIVGQPPRLLISMRDGLAVRVAQNIPAWARDVYGSELAHLSEARLNPGAASFKDAAEIARRLGGDDARVSIANQQGRAYSGVIVGETAEHWLQDLGDKSYAAHFKSGLQPSAQLFRDVEIRYAASGRAVVQDIAPLSERAAARLAAFLELEPAQALKRHPELQGAYELLGKAGDNPQLQAEVRQRLAAGLTRGLVPELQARDAVVPTRKRDVGKDDLAR